MAGLLIKELKLRGAIERILILVPSPLTPQWQDELSEKFDETFEIVDSHSETGQVAGNIWQRKHQCIASIDYAKRDAEDSNSGYSVRDAILQCAWDLIIIDEAHKASASRYDGGIKATQRYKLVEELARSPQVHHMLFLTATPHQGKDEQFQLFLRLLDPDQFDQQNPETLRNLLAEEKCPFFMRRVKEQLRDFDGKKLFLPRNAYTQDFELSGGELDLYKKVSQYIKDFLGRSLSGRRKMAVALARTVLQRRLASSLHAICESLRRRLERLQDLAQQLDKLPAEQREQKLRDAGLLSLDDEIDDDDREDGEKDAVATQISVAESLDALKLEVAELRAIYQTATLLKESGQEEKLMALKRCLETSNFKELREGNGKLLIFTEHKDTLIHLETNLKAWGYSVVSIHGGHSALERKERRRIFEQEVQICIATDAAGEGINLQFCHLMINYDVPWNPNRLEQRMGRIHRIGQDREAHIFNFVATNTVEGKVLSTLIEKLNAIKKDLQTDHIFDVVGTFLRIENLNPEEVLRDAAINPRRAEDFLADIARLSREDFQHFEEVTTVALAKRQLDLSHLHRRTKLHEDVRLMPEYVERFFRQAAEKVGLPLENRADGLLRIPSVPSRLRSPGLRSVQRFGPPRNHYLKATFRKEQRTGKNSDAELLSPGHPLYLAVVELYESRLSRVEGQTALFQDPRTDQPYTLHVFEVSVIGENSSTGLRHPSTEIIDSRFIPVVESHAGVFDIASQDIFHDLIPLELTDGPGSPLLDSAFTIQPSLPEQLSKVATWLKLKVQHPMVQQARTARAQEAAIRRQYLEQAFENSLARLEQQKYEQLDRQESGESDASRRLQKLADDILQVELRRNDRLEAIRRLAVARGGDVRHLASAVVLPVATDPPELQEILRTNREVETFAMQFVLAHEKARGWSPEDVSQLKDGRGYDILSWGPENEAGVRPARRIEVKGRSSSSGDVILTRNEWIKANRLGDDYWLYIVYNAIPDATPRLVVIQNPAQKLASAGQQIVAIKGYRLPSSAISEVSET